MRSIWIALAIAGMLATPLFAADPAMKAIASQSVAGIHVKLSDIWQSPAGKKLLERLAKHDLRVVLESVFGVSPEQIDQLTVVLTQIGRKPEDGLVVRVSTAAPYDRGKLLKNLKARMEPENTSRRSFQIAGRAMLFLGDDRSYTMVYSEHAAVSLLGRLLSNRQAEGAVAGALEKHTATIWLDAQQLPREIWDNAPTELQPLRDVQRLVLTGDIANDSARLSLTMQFPRSGLAADGRRALEEGRGLVRDSFAKLTTELRQDANENAALIQLLGEVQKAIAGARLRHHGTQVAGDTTMPLAPTLQSALVDGVRYLQMRADRVTSINNIKQISLAFHNYESAYGRLPSAAVCDQNGKPLLSWRVTILPYIEQDNLYRQFKLDEPWDSAHNKKLITLMPKIYQLPGDRKKHDLPSTYYQVFVGANAVFQLARGGRIIQIPDGTSNTIWLAEAATAVPWTKPEDIAYDPTRAPKIGYRFGDRCNVGYADGSVRTIRKSLKPEILHLLIQKDDGQVLPPIDD